MCELHRSRVTTLYFRLRLFFGSAGLICLALCLGAVGTLLPLERTVSRLEGRVVDEAGPAARLTREVNTVALQVAVFTRTRIETDRLAAVAAFARLARAIGEERVRRAARDEAGELMDVLRALRPQIIRWRTTFDETAKFLLQSERSTRGLAAQCSLLSSLTLLLATDAGGAFAGERAPNHRKTFEVGLAAIGEIQNSVLFASSLLDPTQLDRADVQQQKFAGELAGLLASTAPSDLREALAEVREKVTDLGDELSNLRTTLTQRNAVQMELVAAGTAAWARLDPIASRVMEDARATAAAASRRLQWTLGGLAAAALLVPLFGFQAGRRLARGIARHLAPVARRLNEGAGATVRQTQEAEVDAKELAESSAGQAAALCALNGNARSVEGAARAILGQMDEATRSAETADRRATEGARSVAALERATREIAESSQRVQATIGVIDEIAFQTNLLALNAAIEAARAGEAGRGFAVVADEVRRLAGRSAGAARETAEVVAVARASSNSGVEAAERVARDFEIITREITAIRTRLHETARRSRRQAEQIEEMTAALRQLDANTSETNAQAQRGAEFAAHLRSHATALEDEASGLARFLSLPAGVLEGARATRVRAVRPLAA